MLVAEALKRAEELVGVLFVQGGQWGFFEARVGT